jgi:hypothetical protein
MNLRRVRVSERERERERERAREGVPMRPIYGRKERETDRVRERQRCKVREFSRHGIEAARRHKLFLEWFAILEQ